MRDSKTHKDSCDNIAKFYNSVFLTQKLKKDEQANKAIWFEQLKKELEVRYHEGLYDHEQELAFDFRTIPGFKLGWIWSRLGNLTGITWDLDYGEQAQTTTASESKTKEREEAKYPPTYTPEYLTASESKSEPPHSLSANLVGLNLSDPPNTSLQPPITPMSIPGTPNTSLQPPTAPMSIPGAPNTNLQSPTAPMSIPGTPNTSLQPPTAPMSIPVTTYGSMGDSLCYRSSLPQMGYPPTQPLTNTMPFSSSLPVYQPLYHGGAFVPPGTYFEKGKDKKGKKQKKQKKKEKKHIRKMQRKSFPMGYPMTTTPVSMATNSPYGSMQPSYPMTIGQHPMTNTNVGSVYPVGTNPATMYPMTTNSLVAPLTSPPLATSPMEIPMFNMSMSSSSVLTSPRMVSPRLGTSPPPPCPLTSPRKTSKNLYPPAFPPSYFGQSEKKQDTESSKTDKLYPPTYPPSYLEQQKGEDEQQEAERQKKRARLVHSAPEIHTTYPDMDSNYPPTYPPTYFPKNEHGLQPQAQVAPVSTPKSSLESPPGSNYPPTYPPSYFSQGEQQGQQPQAQITPVSTPKPSLASPPGSDYPPTYPPSYLSNSEQQGQQPQAQIAPVSTPKPSLESPPGSDYPPTYPPSYFVKPEPQPHQIRKTSPRLEPSHLLVKLPRILTHLRIPLLILFHLKPLNTSNHKLDKQYSNHNSKNKKTHKVGYRQKRLRLFLR